MNRESVGHEKIEEINILYNWNAPGDKVWGCTSNGAMTLAPGQV